MKRISLVAAVACAVALLLAPAGSSRAGEGGFAALEKQVEEITLDNGLKVLVLERHEAPVFSFRTAVNVGGVDEVTGITGIAHMFEHMAFKGTPHIGTTDFEAEREALDRVEEAWHALLAEKRKRHLADPETVSALEAAFKEAQKEADAFVVSNGFSELLEQEGVVGLNAFTAADYTQYMYNLPANRLELWALMEGDRMANPVLREFYKERDVVIEERRMRVESSPTGRLYESFIQTAFVAHPYGYGIIGHRSDLETFTREEALAFFEQHYVAKNMVVAVVGDVETARVEKLANKYFAGISDAPAPPPVDTVEPEQKGERIVIIEDEAQPTIFVGYHMPEFADPRYVAYDALSEILGDGRSSRLYTKMVKEDQIAVQVGASTGFPGRKYPNLMFFYIVPASGVDPDSALAAFDAEIEQMLAEEPATPEELEGVKTRFRARFWRQVESNQGIAGQLATYQVLTGDWRNLFSQVDRVEAITVEDVMEAARECLRKENRTVGILRQTADAS
ncbi:MAG: insulinase family protein [Candidatus Eisenbacteria bacterium]|nr:insulinase family protein [Candidatus Latescibacterota bacterium]MBD3301952.1 insulinase family protein [Candidatus Eisenbacteria bacterium]